MDKETVTKYKIYVMVGLFIGIVITVLTHSNAALVLALGAIVGIVIKRIIVLRREKEDIINKRGKLWENSY